MRIHPHTGAPAATVRRNVRGALGCLITTATAAAFAFAHAAEPHPLVGTWSGTWKPGNGVELTVETVQDNTATGIACYPLKEGGFWFYDLYPGVVEATIDRRGRLRYEARGTRFEYRPHRRDADRMQLREKAKGRTHKLAMHRIDAGTATCRSRVRTIADRSQTPAAPTGESPLIGLWRGRWGETDAVTEVAVWRLDAGTVHATYCHQSGASYWIADLMPGDAHESRVGSGGDLRFREAGGRDVEWIMTPHFGSLSMQYIRDGERSTVRLAKTDEPVCLSRVAPHPDSAARS